MRRISRSPSQIAGKGNEDKIRSKASKRQTKTSQISLGDSSPLRIEKVIPEKASKTKHKFFSSKDKCSSKSPIHVTSKNVKGTLSSGWWSSSRVFMLLCIPTQIAQTNQHFLSAVALQAESPSRLSASSADGPALAKLGLA